MYTNNHIKMSTILYRVFQKNISFSNFLASLSKVVPQYSKNACEVWGSADDIFMWFRATPTFKYVRGY